MSKTTKKQVWVSPNGDNGWKVKTAGSSRPYKILPTKQEAMEIGKQVAQNNNAELIPQKKDGTIQNPNSYGSDPNPPKDKKH